MILVRLVADATAELTADAGTRRITGRLVPYDVAATPSLGPRVLFTPGSLELGDDVWLNREHDDAAVIGRLTDHRDAEDGMHVTFDVLPTSAGSDALVEAAAGARSGLSVEAELLEHTDPDDDGTLTVTAARITGAALVRRPAFTDAAVTDVAATAPPREDHPMDTTTAAPVEPTAPAVEPAPVTYPAPVYAAAGPAPTLPTAGEWLHASLNRDRDPGRYDAMRHRVLAASPDTLLADVPGLVPELIVGDAVAARASDRPLFSVGGPIAGPPGASFRRPVITDPAADAASATELTSVADTVKVTDLDVAYTFVKRAAHLSAESVQFTSPALVNVVTADLARSYARGTEKVAAAAWTAAGGVAAEVDAGDEVEALYDNAATIYAACGLLPDVLAVAPDVWALLGALKATDGRPLFPVIGPSNAVGTSAGASAFAMNVLGLRVVVSYQLGAGIARLAASPMVESYEAHRVQMQAQAPSVMGYELGIGGAAATAVLVAGAVEALTFTGTPAVVAAKK